MKVLLVDDEADLLEILEFLVPNTLPSVESIQKALSGNQAIKILEKEAIDLCICDHNMPDGMGSDVLNFIFDRKLSTKFVLCSTVTPKEKPQEYPPEKIFFNIQKPDIGSGLENLTKILHKPDKTDSRDQVYLPVSLGLLELLEKAPSDIFIRVSSNHYIKVMNSGESFTAEDKNKYSSKPLESLFMRKDINGDIIAKKIDAALQRVQQKKTLPLADKLSIVHSQLVDLIKFSGINPELAELSKKNILQSASFISKTTMIESFWKDLMLVGEYPSKLYTLHSLLTSVVVKKIVWNSEATQFKLSLAAFLQDISLDSISLMELCDYQEFLANEARFSRAEIRRYNEHPQRSVELLGHFKDLPSDIGRILLEQHEMPNGEGFPKKLNATQIGPLSGVFMLTGILARHILRDGTAFDLREFVAVMEAKGYSKGNFSDAFKIIKTTI